MVHVHRSLGSPVLRVLLLLGAAAILPACDGAREDVHVTVVNNGAQSARVFVEGDEDDDEAVVAPASSVTFEYDTVQRVRVKVWRASDGLLLFSDSFDGDDMRRAHDSISVTVTP